MARRLAAPLLLLGAAATVAGLQLLPPPLQSPQVSTAAVWQSRAGPRDIYIEETIASTRDADGLTLIPPSGYDFASLFRQDLSQLTGADWNLHRVDKLPDASNTTGILLGSFTGNASSITYEDGTPTSEGYELVVSPTSVFVGGTGARGLWWGTRTLLQQILLGEAGAVAAGHFVDAPAYRTRGFMLDAGRKWYAPAFLKELCSYASFYKLSEFHYHLSDNYPLNRGHNASWQHVYAQFSLLPEDPALRGIVARPNETLSRGDFADLQAHCAARGVTLIPEIEAPGHCLYLTKWKPELALPAPRDLLNLSHPDTLPTVQRIWAEFLPWFATREVHIGADEYDADLADDYIDFVNDMSAFVANATDGEKRIRIWGTYEPSKENKTISTDVVVQHWQYGQSDPVQLAADGYDVVNSEDWWAYMSLKNDHTPILPAPYPQFFNETRLLNFADEPGRQWSPADFNPVNATLQVAANATTRNRGAIFAAWNDNGPDASTQLEAYYAMRRGFALVGARAWTGSRGPRLVAGQGLDETVDFFSPRAPGQNLDRVLPSTVINNGTLLSWTRSAADGNGDDVHLGHGSKGLNYTLTLSATGPFSLAGPDDSLSLDEDGHLVFVSDGWPYPLRSVAERDALDLDPGLPGRIWTNVSTSTHAPVAVSVPANITVATDALHGSVVWVDGTFAGRFEVFVFGGRNTLFSWSQMAFVAPLENITGSGLAALTLEGEVKAPSGSRSTPPSTTNAAISAARTSIVWMLVVAMFAGTFVW